MSLSHAGWCRFLASIGSLDRQHRRCMETVICVAPRLVPQEWRYERAELVR